MTQLLHRLRMAWQYLTRGFSDGEVFGLQWSLAAYLAPRLRRLKEKKAGVPAQFFPSGPQYIGEDGGYTDRAWEIAQEHFDFVLNEMIEGFELLARDLHTGCIETADQEAKVQRAFDLLAKHHHTLWY